MSTAEIGSDKTSGGLSRIPFTVAAEARIKSLASWLSILGYVGIAASVLDLLSLLSPGRNLGQISNAIVHLLIGIWCLKAGKAFQKVVTSDENDQGYLVEGFRELRKIFLFQGIMILIALAFVTAAGLFLLVHGGSVTVK